MEGGKVGYKGQKNDIFGKRDIPESCPGIEGGNCGIVKLCVS